MKRVFLITLVIGLFYNLAYSQTPMSILIPEGSAIKLTLKQRLDSGDKDLKVGDKVRLQADNNVTVGGHVIIKRHAEAEGHIIEKKRSSWLGRKGKIDFKIDWVTAVDGTKIPLRAVAKRGGKSHGAGMVAAAALVSPVSLFMRGKNAVIKRGTKFTSYVNSEEHITVSGTD